MITIPSHINKCFSKITTNTKLIKLAKIRKNLHGIDYSDLWMPTTKPRSTYTMAETLQRTSMPRRVEVSQPTITIIQTIPTDASAI